MLVPGWVTAWALVLGGDSWSHELVTILKAKNSPSDYTGFSSELERIVLGEGNSDVDGDDVEDDVPPGLMLEQST